MVQVLDDNMELVETFQKLLRAPERASPLTLALALPAQRVGVHRSRSVLAKMSFDYAAIAAPLRTKSFNCPPTRFAHLHCDARSAVQVSGTTLALPARASVVLGGEAISL
jgi:hypothetical protein